MLQKAGGLFQLLAEVDFGTAFGVKSLYYKSRTTNPADAGQVRLARADVISWRNQLNSANLDLSVNSSNALLFNGNPLQGGISVTDTATIDLTFVADSLSADIITGSITNAMVNAAAAIAYSKLNLTGGIVNADVNASAAIAYSKLNLTGSIVNADVNAAAAIAYSKLNLSGSIVNADINASAAIAYSKLALTGSIVNADISVSAAIAYSKLSLSNSILNADINSAAAIAYSKLALTGSIVNADISASAAIAYSKLTLTGSILNADINASAAIAFSKLATLSSTNILVGSAGNVATAVAMSGDITIGNTGVTAIGANKVTNAMLAQIATATFKGRTTASTGNVEDLTATQATALLNTMVGDSGSGGTKGLVPAPSTGDATRFLNGAGAWSTPAGAGDVSGPGSATDNGFVRFDGTTGKLIKNSAATITNADIISSAAIAFSKLASLTSAHILVGSVGNVATDVAVTGDISLSASGVTAYSGTVPLNKGGTGQTAKAAAFDALSPMSAGGDLIYGGASGTGTRLANGSAGDVLSSGGTTAAPVWFTPGQYTEAKNATPTNYPTNGTINDGASFTLAAGTYDLTAMTVCFAQTNTTEFYLGISSTTGNFTTGLNNGENYMRNQIATAVDTNLVVANYRVTPSTSTTYYMKVKADYTGSTPQYSYRFSAVRVK